MHDAKSVIVYGPQGCGKTQNAAAMVKHFGLGRSEDLDRLSGHLTLAPTGVLYLTNYTREEMVDAKIIDKDARRVFSFDEAMAYMQPVDTKAWATIEVNDGDVQHELTNAGNLLTMICHGASLKAGWWSHNKTGLDLVQVINAPTDELQKLLGGALVAQKLCLTHSEVSEGMEGHRKGLMDDKLPHRTMLEVELADAVIRIADLAGALGLDLGGAIAEKMAFNAVRPDHKKEARESAGGKSY